MNNRTDKNQGAKKSGNADRNRTDKSGAGSRSDSNRSSSGSQNR